nr:hypothetical protein [Tanacetum cinerariifolium]
GTTLGRMSPSAACSALTEAGGVQVGLGVLAVTLVVDTGEPQPSRPIPSGKVYTTFWPFGAETGPAAHSAASDRQRAKAGMRDNIRRILGVAARAADCRTEYGRRNPPAPVAGRPDALELPGTRTGRAAHRARSVDRQKGTRRDGAAWGAPVRGRHISRKP